MTAERVRDERKPKVLIVEDNEMTADCLVAQCHHVLGWGALLAGSMAEARALLGERPNAVLLDLGLPDGRGEDLIEEIRDRCPDCRIIIVTGLPEGGPRMTAIAASGPDYIAHKPYDLDILLASIQGTNSSPPPLS